MNVLVVWHPILNLTNLWQADDAKRVGTT